MGSAPNAAATADVTHPAKGFIQTIGVLVDTFLVCTSTAFIVLCSGAYKATNLEGIELTQNALSSQIGPWASSLAIIIFLFAFSSLLGNYYYGETNIEFIKQSKTWLTIYRIAVVEWYYSVLLRRFRCMEYGRLIYGSNGNHKFNCDYTSGRFAYAALADYVRQKTRKRSSLPCRFYSWFNEYRVLG